MARRKASKVTLRRHGNQEAGVFVATFRDPRKWQDAKDRSKGHRVVRKSLKTADRVHAEKLVAHLERIIGDRSLWKVVHQDCPATIREVWFGLKEDIETDVDGETVSVLPAPGVSRPVEVETDWAAVDPDWDGFTLRPEKLANKGDRQPVKVTKGDYAPQDKLKSLATAYRAVLAELETLRKDCEAYSARVQELEVENQAARAKLRLYNRRAAKAAQIGTLAEELEKYLADIQARKITHKRKGILRSTLSRFTADIGPDRKADDVSEQEVSRYILSYRQANGRPISEERRREIRLQVCTFLEISTNFLFSRKAVAKVSSHQVAREKKPILWLEPEEVAVLLKQVYLDFGEYWGDLATIQVYMGFRPSELILLQKANVSDGVVTLEPISDTFSGASHAKTGGRSVRIPKEAAGIIRRRVRKGQGPFLFGVLQKLSKKSNKPIARRDGRTGILADAWNEDVFYKRYTGLIRQAAKKAGIGKQIDGRTLRRTFGSIAIRSGYSVEEVARVMGDRASTIRRHYARLEAREVDLTNLTISVE